MHLAHITTNYTTYLKQFYDKHPELKNGDYQLQHQALIADCFGWADFWSHAMKPLGYKVTEYIANVKPLQEAWAKENNVTFEHDKWMEQILSAQIKAVSPEILFVDDYLSFTGQFINELRQECQSIKLVLGWCGAPYNDESVFNSYDIVLSNIPEFVTAFRNNGHQAEYMMHAFEPRILSKITINNSSLVNFSFLGSIVKTSKYHIEREQLLKKLIKHTDLQIWSDVSSSSLSKFKLLPLRQILYEMVQLSHKNDQLLSLISNIPKIKDYAKMNTKPSSDDYIDQSIVARSHSPLYGLSMFQQLANSKVTFNNHINVSPKYASNMRIFEATGVGTCLLTDQKDNLHQLFELDHEIVAYSNAEEAIEKVKYLLDNDHEREKIAKAGQTRTLKDHTFAQRAVQLDEIIRKKLS